MPVVVVASALWSAIAWSLVIAPSSVTALVTAPSSAIASRLGITSLLTMCSWSLLVSGVVK